MLISKKLKWDVNATFSRNVINNYASTIPVYDSLYNFVRNDVEKFKATSISFSPEMIVGSHLSYDLTNNVTLHVLSKYVGKQYIDNTKNDNQKIDAYFINDLRINLKFKTKYISKIEIIFMLNNIFNAKYVTNAWDSEYKMDNESVSLVDKGFYPQAGRNFMI